MNFAFPWGTQRPARGKDRGSPDPPVSFASGARAALRVPSREQRAWAGLQHDAQAQSLSCRHRWASLIYLPEKSHSQADGWFPAHTESTGPNWSF